LRTLVMRPCMMRKCGLLTLSCTLRNMLATCDALALWPLMRYLFVPPMTTCRHTLISSNAS